MVYIESAEKSSSSQMFESAYSFLKAVSVINIFTHLIL